MSTSTVPSFRPEASGRRPSRYARPVLGCLGVLVCVHFSLAQEFRIGDYRAEALIGEARLIEGRDYVSFAGDTGLRDWLPTQEALDDWLTAEAGLLAHFQLNVINLEFGLPGFTGREMDVRIDRIMTGVLRQVGCSLVSVGNNHVLDYGPEGISHTVAELQKADVQVIGLRSHPVYLWQASGRRIAIYSLTAGTDKDDPQRLTVNLDNDNLAWIQELTERASFRIAFVHLGSMSSYPSEHERREAVRLVERGADLVVLTGSHFFKGFVLEKGKPVVYGLGDHFFSYVGDETETLGTFLVAGFGPSGWISFSWCPSGTVSIGAPRAPSTRRNSRHS